MSTSTALLLFISGALLFALGGPDPDAPVDAYIVAGCLIASGGGGFLLSHFVIADHFRGGPYFGLIHTLLNGKTSMWTIENTVSSGPHILPGCDTGAFDSSTVTMAALEVGHLLHYPDLHKLRSPPSS